MTNVLKALTDKALSFIHDSTSKGDAVQPFVVVQTHKGVKIQLPVYFKNAAEKAQAVHMLKLCFGIWHVKAYVMVCEVWTTETGTTPGDAPEAIQHTALPRYPDTAQGILLAGASHTDTVAGFVPTVRYGHEIAVGDVEWYGKGEGHAGGEFLELLPPVDLGPPPAHVEKAFYERWPYLRFEEPSL